MAVKYILARTLREAHEFAREELNLSRGQYRIVTSPSSISAVRGADIYLVPGWENRHDKFAMRGALRYTRLNKIDVAELRKDELEPDGLNPPSVQLTLAEGVDESLLADFDAFLKQGVNDEDTAGTPESAAGDLVDPAEEGAEVTHLAPGPDAIKQIEQSLAEKPMVMNAIPEPEVLEEAPVKRTRRRRCPECYVLVDPDEVEAHAAEHLPTED